MNTTKGTKPSAEIINDFHTELKKEIGHLVAVEKDLRKWMAQFGSNEAVLISAIDDAVTNIQRAVYNLEEEINS